MQRVCRPIRSGQTGLWLFLSFIPEHEVPDNNSMSARPDGNLANPSNSSLTPYVLFLGAHVLESLKTTVNKIRDHLGAFVESALIETKI